MVENNEDYGHSRPSEAHTTATPNAGKNREQTSQPIVNQNAGIVENDPWQSLKQFTNARIALGRAGTSLPTKEILNFGYAHAMARDAVHIALDVTPLETDLHNLGLHSLLVCSSATDRHTFLLRPDLGRQLDDASRTLLQQYPLQKPIDLLLVVGDGLSSMAITRNAVPLIQEIIQQIPEQWNLGPIVIATQSRVALGDDIGALLNARMVAILIGERPGLSSPDSLGIYLTYNPNPGCTDADRNCISNIRPEGLSYKTAARKLVWLCKEALRIKATGVVLKDESDGEELGVTGKLSV